MSAPQRIGQYEVLRRIAVGGMAEIFLGRLRRPGGFEKTVVIKQLLPHLARDRGCVALMQDEARLAALLDHANIVQVFDFGEDNGSFYIAMEYLVGEDLASVLNACRQRGHTVPVPELLAIASSVAGALHYAHTLTTADGVGIELIHRDVTPRNIVVTEHGGVKLVDFGIARARTRSLQTEPGAVRGNVMFIAPEYAQGAEIDHRVDVYALGLTMLDCLAGELPLNASHLAQMTQGTSRVPRLADLVPTADPALDAIIAKATADHPDARYATAAEMQLAIDDLRQGYGRQAGPTDLGRMMVELFGTEFFAEQRRNATVPAGSTLDEPTPVRAGSRVPWPAVSLVLALAAGAAGGWAFLRPSLQTGGLAVPPSAAAAATEPALPAAPERPGKRPVAASGAISLRSDLPLRVHVGTSNLGLTPLADVPLPAGTHKVRLTSGELGIAATRTVVVRSGETARLDVDLKKGRLWVDTDVPADVWIANHKIGSTPLAGVEYWEGDYTLVFVNREKNIEKSRRVVIQPKGELRVSERLVR